MFLSNINRLSLLEFGKEKNVVEIGSIGSCPIEGIE